MMHWPEKLKWIEGRKSRIKYLQGFVREFANAMENIFVRISLLPSSGINHKEERRKKIIVSLTSFPHRINRTYYAIKSLMRQSVKADRIVLWLAEPQFPDRKLPPKFDKLIKRGLEVRFTSDDLKSHKKYFYMLSDQQPDELVVTFDDDLIYEKTALKRVLSTHETFPDKIVCNRVIPLEYNEKEDIIERKEGEDPGEEGLRGASFRLEPSTGAGCLYPYGVMPPSTFDKTSIKSLAASADDLWIWYNSLIGNVGIVRAQKHSRVLSPITGSQEQTLNEINHEGGENQRVLRRLMEINRDLIKKGMK